MTTVTRARSGPAVHVLIDREWQDRRAFILVRPTKCRVCRVPVQPGETVVRTPGDLGYACRGCVSHHVRGQAECPLCLRLRMDGRKCRACGGTGFGQKD